MQHTVLALRGWLWLAQPPEDTFLANRLGVRVILALVLDPQPTVPDWTVQVSQPKPQRRSTRAQIPQFTHPTRIRKTVPRSKTIVFRAAMESRVQRQGKSGRRCHKAQVHWRVPRRCRALCGGLLREGRRRQSEKILCAKARQRGFQPSL